jgi:hypothetical protein
MVALSVVFAVIMAALWMQVVPSKKPKTPSFKIRLLGDELDIEPADVPQFEPSWRDS